MKVKRARNVAFAAMVVSAMFGTQPRVEANHNFYCESENIYGNVWTGSGCYTHCVDVESVCTGAPCYGVVDYCYTSGEVVAGCQCETAYATSLTFAY